MKMNPHNHVPSSSETFTRRVELIIVTKGLNLEYDVQNAHVDILLRGPQTFGHSHSVLWGWSVRV